MKVQKVEHLKGAAFTVKHNEMHWIKPEIKYTPNSGTQFTEPV
jgi:hypothetical protein